MVSVQPEQQELALEQRVQLETALEQQELVSQELVWGQQEPQELVLEQRAQLGPA